VCRTRAPTFSDTLCSQDANSVTLVEIRELQCQEIDLCERYLRRPARR
jgi:hypothetical protein